MYANVVRRSTRTVLVSVAIVAACADQTTAPDLAARQPGILQLEGYTGAIAQEGPIQPVGSPVRWSGASQDAITPPAVIDGPAVVDAGVPFELTAYTIGESGCWSADGLDVQISDRTVTIMPYDALSGAEVCTLILRYLPHRTTLQLDERGEWVIRVRGRRARHGDPYWHMPVSAEVTVTVR